MQAALYMPHEGSSPGSCWTVCGGGIGRRCRICLRRRSGINAEFPCKVSDIKAPEAAALEPAARLLRELRRNQIIFLGQFPDSLLDFIVPEIIKQVIELPFKQRKIVLIAAPLAACHDDGQFRALPLASPCHHINIRN